MRSSVQESASEATLHNSGLAVFRNMREAQSVNLTLGVREQVGDMSGVVLRGLGPEYQMAANIMSRREVMQSRKLGKLPVQEVMDQLYREVGSLRSRQQVAVRHVGFIVTKAAKHASLMLERDPIATERQEIADVLRSMSGLAITDSIDIRRNYTPHISVCKLPPSSSKSLMEEVSQAIEDNASDSVLLQRASFYTNTNH